MVTTYVFIRVPAPQNTEQAFTVEDRLIQPHSEIFACDFAFVSSAHRNNFR